MSTTFNPDDTQIAAINACTEMSSRLVAVTGKAGTGKTSIIKEVYNRLRDAGYTVACSAPTGRAAKRITEATGIPAVTNHRLLGFGMPEEIETEDRKGNFKIVKVSTKPKFNKNNPLAYDVVLCDEYAMTNHEINRSIIDALKPGAGIRMFGDVNQLRPIEENKVIAQKPTPFQEALTRFVGIELTTIHRQQEGSGIAENGARILRGAMPVRFPDFDIKFTDSPVDFLKDHILKLDAEEGIDYQSLDNQIITCMNKSWIGTQRLNHAMQTLYWDREKPYADLPRNQWSGEAKNNPPIRVQVGSKVVYTANTYDLGNEQSAFNGETGIITELHEDGCVDIDFGDRIVSVPPLLYMQRNNGDIVELDPRKNIDLAYVLTTHKMQGSECKRIIYILNKSTSYAQSRRNAYTAITRGRNHVTVITDQISLHRSVKSAE